MVESNTTDERCTECKNTQRHRETDGVRDAEVRQAKKELSCKARVWKKQREKKH